MLVAIVLVCVLLLPSWLSALLLGVPWTLGAWEWGRLVGWPRAVVWAYALVFALLALAGGGLFDAAGAMQIAQAAASWWLLAFIGVTRFPWRIPTVIVAAAGLMALLPSWLLLAYLHNFSPNGPALVLSVLFIVWAADVGAFFCGRTFGRAKLAPKVSPGKTWEGVLGGLVGATSAASLAGLWLGQSVLGWAVTGLATALASVVGDLTVSMCKRQAGVKDSGHLLPGHGGILDRIDSLTSAVPIFFLGLSLAGLLR
jgi:phosphatidate cytidylyltransferase